MPKVSVIIPVYGVEKYIERCARSLFEQTLDGIEYIFVDDCSPDKSMEILMRIIEEYRHRLAKKRNVVRIESMSMNSGQAAVRRRGIQLCTGDYVIHCDSDDWVDIDMYRQLYDEAKRINADVVMCGYKTTDGNHVFNESFHKYTYKHELVSNLLTLRESVSMWDKMFKRNLYDDTIIYPTYAMGEDMVLTIQLVLKSEKVGVVENPLYNYVYNPTSITNTQTEDSRYKHWIESAKNAALVESIFKDRGLECEYKKELLYLKFLQKMLAGKLMLNRKYSKEWLTIFSEINWEAVCVPIIPYKEKMKFLGKLLMAKLLSV